MSTIILAVPEEHAREFIKIVRDGLAAQTSLTPSVKEGLEGWISDTEEYLAEDI